MFTRICSSNECSLKSCIQAYDNGQKYGRKPLGIGVDTLILGGFSCVDILYDICHSVLYILSHNGVKVNKNLNLNNIRYGAKTL